MKTDTTDEITLEQYQAKAMLLGMAYDPRDHSFVAQANYEYVSFDADNMEKINQTMHAFAARVKDVKYGRVGPKWLSDLSQIEKDTIWYAERHRAFYT